MVDQKRRGLPIIDCDSHVTKPPDLWMRINLRKVLYENAAASYHVGVDAA